MSVSCFRLNYIEMDVESELKQQVEETSCTTYYHNEENSTQLTCETLCGKERSSEDNNDDSTDADNEQDSYDKIFYVIVIKEEENQVLEQENSITEKPDLNISELIENQNSNKIIDESFETKNKGYGSKDNEGLLDTRKKSSEHNTDYVACISDNIVQHERIVEHIMHINNSLTNGFTADSGAQIELDDVTEINGMNNKENDSVNCASFISIPKANDGLMKSKLEKAIDNKILDKLNIPETSIENNEFKKSTLDINIIELAKGCQNSPNITNENLENENVKWTSFQQTLVESSKKEEQDKEAKETKLLTLLRQSRTTEIWFDSETDSLNKKHSYDHFTSSSHKKYSSKNNEENIIVKDIISNNYDTAAVCVNDTVAVKFDKSDNTVFRSVSNHGKKITYIRKRKRVFNFKIKRECVLSRTDDGDMAKPISESDFMEELTNCELGKKKKLKALDPDNLFKSYKKSLTEMTRYDVENICIMEIVQSILKRCSLKKLQERAKTMSQSIEEYKRLTEMLAKQNKDLHIILKCIQERQKQSDNMPIIPLKVTRSVGLQAVITSNSQNKTMSSGKYNLRSSLKRKYKPSTSLPKPIQNDKPITPNKTQQIKDSNKTSGMPTNNNSATITNTGHQESTTKQSQQTASVKKNGINLPFANKGPVKRASAHERQDMLQPLSHRKVYAPVYYSKPKKNLK